MDLVRSGFAARCEAGLCPAGAWIKKKGLCPFTFLAATARRSLASHRAAKPLRETRWDRRRWSTTVKDKKV